MGHKLFLKLGLGHYSTCRLLALRFGLQLTTLFYSFIALAVFFYHHYRWTPVSVDSVIHGLLRPKKKIWKI